VRFPPLFNSHAIAGLSSTRVAFLDRHAVLSEIVAVGQLRDPTRVLFVVALPADENLAVVKNLQFPGPALPRVIPEFAAVNVALWRSDAPDFFAR